MLFSLKTCTSTLVHRQCPIGVSMHKTFNRATPAVAIKEFTRQKVWIKHLLFYKAAQFLLETACRNILYLKILMGSVYSHRASTISSGEVWANWTGRLQVHDLLKVWHMLSEIRTWSRECVHVSGLKYVIRSLILHRAYGSREEQWRYFIDVKQFYFMSNMQNPR